MHEHGKRKWTLAITTVRL